MLSAAFRVGECLVIEEYVMMCSPMCGTLGGNVWCYECLGNGWCYECLGEWVVLWVFGEWVVLWVFGGMGGVVGVW